MTVYLVGAGPGDPGLITRRGAEVLAAADVVVHDRLSAPELLDLAPEDAERIDVGKAPGLQRMTQAEIDALLVERGRTGATVVRLKGGDPFVFARGAEEAAALIAAGVDHEVVPGVTSAIAVPAHAGIPVTRRFSSTSFTVVTGHTDPASDDDVDWDALARVGGTIVVLMGVRRWPAIAERLIAAGRSPQTPAAAIRWGTRPNQETTRATLATLGDHPLEAPSVIVVGDVASEDVSWAQQLPLTGRSVVVTRARAQASELAARLRALGAEVIEAPVNRAVDPTDGGDALRAAIRNVEDYDLLILTSPNAAERTLAAIPDVRCLAGVTVAVTGTGTGEVVRRHRIEPDIVPERFFAESLLEAVPSPPAAGGRVLLASAEGARPVLEEGLRAAGWDVDVAHPHATVAVPVDERTAERVAAADAVTFTASSTVRNLVAEVGVDGVPPTVVSIGPITSATAAELGIAVTAEADPHDLDGLVEALLAVLSNQERASG